MYTVCMITPLREHLVEYAISHCFSSSCLLCGRQSSRPLCSDCLDIKYLDKIDGLSLWRDSPHRCAHCGRPLISRNKLCTSCLTLDVLSVIDRVLPLFYYSPANSLLLNSWKTHGQRGLGYPFARMMSIPILEILVREKDMIIVPVPPRPGKIREKGWDQIEELGTLLQRYWKLPVKSILTRTATMQQKKLNRAGRLSNLKGCITAKKSLVGISSALVIDDIMTTGATLESCAAALKESGVSRVYGCTLFFD